MARRTRTAIPTAQRMTLLEWIEHDENGDTPNSTQPTCSARDQALHARIVSAPEERGAGSEPLDPPRGLHLAPLG